MQRVKGIIIDIENRRKFKGEVHIEDGKISRITETNSAPEVYIFPGFVDAHIHIESSMLVPSEFARQAVRHGTVATVSDPHEIANVCGKQGVEYMIDNGRKVPLKFHFGAPSCVPATPFETAGAELDVQAVTELLDRSDIYYLAEMMNWPGVLNDDPDVLAKIKAARERGKPIDGHAPGLKGNDARKYASAGITTDHECFTREEALDKLEAGMLIAIREGSAAKNYDALISLLGEYPGKIMFCSDDKHPDDLINGHINELAARSLGLGYDLYDILYACCILPVKHYGMNVGLLREGEPADFVVVDNLESMHVSETWIDGSRVYDTGGVHFDQVKSTIINNFTQYSVNESDFADYSNSDRITKPVIDAFDGELITGKHSAELPVINGKIQPDTDQDILKVAVVNRYQKAKPSVGYIRNFGIKNGAIASSVAHDSHNIIVVGSSDHDLSRAVNLIMEKQGGISAVTGDHEDVLPLPVAGIMTDQSGEEVAEAYSRLSKMALDMGGTMKAAFMSISFMALLVIPSLKMSDKGLFDGETFTFVDQ